MRPAARPAAAAAAFALLLLAAPGASAVGLLLAGDAGDPLALKHYRVDVEARDGTAVTKVEQVFVNRTGRPLEATFLFPLPDDAVLIDFKLLVNGEMKKGEVLPRGEAERIYSDIVRRMRDPGLIDWMGGNLFRARIFPVPAHGEQRVELRYTQVLPFLDGTYKLVHPLKAPGGAARTLEDFTLTVRLEHATPLRAVYSPTHRLHVARKGDRKAIVGFERDAEVLDRDFVLFFGVSDKDVGVQVLTHRVPGEPGYFLLLASPRAVFAEGERPRKAVTFVLDTSGSMAGQKIEHARRALLWCLDQLGPDDVFNVVRFSSDVESLGDRLVTADAAHVGEARRFVEGFEAAGGTAIEEALQVALEARLPDGAPGPHLVVFITDGRPTVGETDVDKILERSRAWNRDEARVFTFGVGDELDTVLLDRVAAAHGGTSAYVRDADLEVQVAALYSQLAHPVLTDLRLEVSNVRPFAMLPGGKLPDLFKGQQLVLVGRYRDARDALIRLRGTLAGRERTWDYELSFPEARADNAFVASIWAHRQVGFLLDQIRQSGETPELRDEVVQLATRYGIVTPYTSYLVVEDEAAARLPTAEPMRLPRPVPMQRSRDLEAPRGGASRARPLDGELPREEAEDSLRDGFQGNGGASGGPPAPAGAPATSREVPKAKALKHLQSKRTVTEDVRGVRHVGGKVMQQRGDRWVDAAWRDGLPAVSVAPYSPAWWRVVTLRPELRSVLALGERVTVVVGGVALVVEPGGAERLTADQERRLSR